MGPHLRMRWDTWGSSRVVAGNSAFIYNCDGDLWAPLSCLKGVKFLSSFEREPGIALEVLQEKRASSCIEGGISWFVSSCGWRLEIPLQVPRRTQGASRVASGKSSLHSTCEGERECSGVTAGESGLNSLGRGNLKVFLELRQEVWVPSSCHRDLREPLVLSLGSQESF